MSKIRVLHTANKLNPGGVERWLLGVAKGLSQSEIKIDILLHSAEPGVFDDEVKTTGSKLLYCPHSRNPFSYGWQLYKLLKNEGPFDVVHSHMHHFSGFILMIAFFAGVNRRIAHSHSNRSDIEPKKGPRAWYLLCMKYLIKWFSTDFIAVSQEARKSLFGNVVKKERIDTLYCGIESLSCITTSDDYYQSLGLSADVCVVGHVGRISTPKNHTFLLKIFAAFIKIQPAKLVLIGDGELMSEVKAEIEHLSLQEHVLVLGSRNDAVDVMASIFDVIAFPSLYEGLPLTVVEAQAAGVPILVADNITREAEFDSQLVAYESLQKSAEEWAQSLQTMLERRPETHSSDAYKMTDFYMPNHINRLKQLYID